MLLTKFDWYIIRKFVSTFIFILLILIVICIVFDISEKIDDFLGKEIPLNKIIFVYYLNFIPWLVNTFSALFVFITVIFFTSNMASKTEFVAALAGGISFNRLIRPYILVATLIAVLSFLLNSYVLPKSNKKRFNFMVEYIQKNRNGWSHNVHQQIFQGQFIYIQNFNVEDKIGYKFTLEKFKDSRLLQKTEAERIIWNDTTKTWKLENLVIRDFENGAQKISAEKFRIVEMNYKPEDFGERSTDITTMTDPELKQYIATQKSRGVGNSKVYYVELYKRKALPFAGIILAFIGVSIASRKIRGGIGMHLFLGIALAFTYILIMQIANTFAMYSNLNPFIAVWAPNLIYFIISLFIYKYAPK